MQSQPRPSSGEPTLRASVIITTYNRCDALEQTLNALGDQTLPPDRYEVLVVDDGSVDDTYAVVSRMSLPCELSVFRHAENRGVSAGRNTAIRKARGRYLILMSDDLVVPKNFIATHIETLERFARSWVVGGFEQIGSLLYTPFGRYLDGLERSYEEARRASKLENNLWEMSWPTARNLSLPREDLGRIGLFDERFRTTCEDQDLAHRAREVGIRFIYNAAITCLHNDQAGDLRRHCEFQRRGAHDTVLLCAKYPAAHGGAAIARVNGYISLQDGPILTLKKSIKRVLATRPIAEAIERLISLAERARAPDRLLWKLYRTLIGVYIFRGWREGLRSLERKGTLADVHGVGCHSNI